MGDESIGISGTCRGASAFGTRLGFSLLELLITLAVISIALGLAVPSFGQTLARNRLAATVNELQLALVTARQIAVTENVPVTFCAGNPRVGCHREWQAKEWILFVDHDHDGSQDGDDTLRLSASRSGALTLAVNGPFRTAVVFGPLGNAETISGAFAAGRIRVCSTELHEDNATDLVLIGSGRAEPEPRNFNGSCPAP